jgi:putative dimethyl sulfoxide reductase chaperone
MKSETESTGEIRQWSPTIQREVRSIFANFRPPEFGSRDGDSVPAEAVAGDEPSLLEPGLQPSIDAALARSFLYRWLAQAFEHPTRAGWQCMTSPQRLASVELAITTLARQYPSLRAAAAGFQGQLNRDGFDRFHDGYVAVFGHAARGRCPLNEIEYGEIKADPLFQPHRLADLASFYRAFGLEVTEDAGERQDHISLELEFMCVLAAKEAYALEHQLDDLALCRDAQRRFLKEHLGRWVPAFARRLAQGAAGTPLEALARVTRAFVETEGTRFQLRMGSEDLMLRPVDEAGERMCGTCGVKSP